jgi:hypothetical protein
MLTENAFEEREFSKHLANLLERLSGQRVTSNLLRSSFVSALYAHTADPVVRESAAAVLRHSTNEASRTYDRRNPSAKKELGQSVLAKMSIKRELEAMEETPRLSKTVDCKFDNGDCVVVPYHNQDSGEPSFHFAYVIKSTPSETTLMELVGVNIPEHLFKLKLNSVWSEPTSASYHVLYDFIRESGCYRLISPAADIRGVAQ